MVLFSTKVIKTDVTAIKVRQDFIFAAIGGHLHIFDRIDYKLKKVLKVFNSRIVHGIEFTSYDHNLLLYGENVIKTFIFIADNIDLEETNSVSTADWILTAKWIDNAEKITSVSVHNIVIVWNNSLQKLQAVVCEERCLLYSATICYNSWDELVILSGTVFSEILIWWPFKSQRKNDMCPVSHRLQGHKGVIFSVFYNEDHGFLCSTSDDRSTMLWSVLNTNLSMGPDLVQFKLLCKVYGHSARVFRSYILDDSFLSAGEDSLVNVWDFKGKLLRRIEAHQNDSIWAIDCDKEKQIVVTGGGDGGITITALKQNVHLRQLNVADGVIPKRIGLLNSGSIAFVTEIGSLYMYDTKRDVCAFVHEDVNFKDYVVMDISSCRRLVVLAGFVGNIYIYKEKNNNLKMACFYQMSQRHRIFAVHWLTCKLLLTCGPEGKLQVWTRKKRTLLLIAVLILPYSKERWTTSACLTSNKRIVVGDRKGHIHVYRLGCSSPIQTIKKAHSHLGVTNIFTEDNTVYTMGRNGILKAFVMDALTQQLILASSDKLPFTWLTRLVRNDRSTLVMGFSGDQFIIWDYISRKTVLEQPCGGGHRSWDFMMDSKSISFIYIKNKIMHLLNCDNNMVLPLNLVPSFHSLEVNSINVIGLPNTCDDYVLVSGGEDTTLRISKFCKSNSKLIALNVLKSHLSSIRTITSCEIASDGKSKKYVLFSAGGRAQIVVWELLMHLHTNEVTCFEKYSYHEPLNQTDSEIRIMDLTCLKINNYCLLLFVACSDGKIKVFISHSNKEITHLETISYKLCCILKITTMDIYGHNLLITMATDGKIVFWDVTNVINAISGNTALEMVNVSLKELEAFEELAAHQSGINSYAFKILEQNQILFLTGGDDNAIVIHLINVDVNSRKLTVLNKFTDVGSHCAQITGIFISEDYFFTASIDQKIIVFRWQVEHNKFKCSEVGRYITPVPDIQGMNVINNCDTHKIIIFGKGLEILEMQYS